LEDMGYDPALVDPYFDRLDGRNEAAMPRRSDDFYDALKGLGLADMGPGGLSRLEEDTLWQGPPVSLDSPAPPEAPTVFGLDLFSQATDQFTPVAMGPVDPGYRLGPGDELILVLTGDVELAYDLEVTREGFVVVPSVGQISVNGLTLDDLRDRFFERLGHVYSGVTRGPDATTRFTISLGRLRTNQVFLIGDVARPGAYQISSLATVLNALYRGGGPTSNGSFRAVRVIRSGETVAEVDLYDYLLKGDASDDIRLANGDIVFVPPAGPQVTIKGEVVRPAIYELRGAEHLLDLFTFSGGVRPEANLRRIQIDRILPPERREPGKDRVLIDVEPSSALGQPEGVIPLETGDVVSVLGVLEQRKNRVTLRGEVWRPGEYEYSQGMTLWDLIRKADGLGPSAFRPLAHILRLVPETGRTRVLKASLEIGTDGTPLDDPLLSDLDEVVVYDLESLLTEDSVSISGRVRTPGAYPLWEGMTVEDLILAAGGFTQGARASEAEVVRLRLGFSRTDTLSTHHILQISEAVPPHPDGPRLVDTENGAESRQKASDFELQGGDQVFIRRLPGYVGPRSVGVLGEVLFPGSYAFELREERLSSFVRRAGGPTGDAYLPGARLYRDSVLVGIDLERALDDPGKDADVAMEPGDELIIPAYDPTVLVEGSVAFPARVLFNDGRGLDGYLAEAGGTLAEADLDRISVRHASGERAVARKVLGLFRRYPDVEPGSVIYVPAQLERDGFDWDQFFAKSLSLTSALLTILIASRQL